MPPKPNIFFFHGEDTYSIHQKIKFWIDQFKIKYGDDTNIEVIEAAKINPKEFATNLQSLPFLAEKRLVIIKNLLEDSDQDTQEKIIESLENIPDFCILVFAENTTPDKRTSGFKNLCKLAKTEEFQPLSPIELTNWILKTTEAHKGKISRQDAEFLASQIGADLWRLSNEIDKLITATQPQNLITKSLIESLVTPSLSSSIFKLTDAIAAKKHKDSLRIFKTLIDSGEEAMMVFHMIVRQFRILIQAHYLVSQKEDQASMAKKLKMHPYVVMTACNQSKNFTAEKLKEIYARLLEIDTRFKTGKIKITTDDNRELLLELEKFIIEV